jgi:hypothetical protein
MTVPQLSIMHVMPKSCMYSNYGENNPEHNEHMSSTGEISTASCVGLLLQFNMN